MSISKVRVQINGTWHTLTYNSTTQRYEKKITLSASSYGQSGGYYNATAEVTNSSGSIVTENGSSMTSLRLVVRETGAPSISLVSPAQGYLTTARPTFTINITDAGTGVNTSAITVKLDGSTISPTRTSITNGYRLTYTPSSNLSQGAHTLTVSAKDYDGNAGSASYSWTVDTVAPTLAVSNPTNGQILTNPSLTVRGTVSDATSGLSSVTVNGTSVAVSSGSFSRTVTLTEGNTTITVVATDKAGNKTTITRTVTYDAGAPVITVLSPTDGLIANQKTVTTTGTVVETGTGLASFKINGQEVPLSGNSFSVDLTLAEGQQTITYTATDNAGLTATTTRQVTVDTIPPSLTVTAPAEGTLFGVSTITVSGSVSDSGTGLSWVSVDGQDVPVTNGTFSVVLTKPDGNYAIVVAAMDRAGNRADVTRSVTVDTAPPVVTIDAPADGATLTTRPIIVSGEAYDTGTGLKSLTVNGTPVTATDGRYSVEIDPPEGDHTIIVTGTDNAGVSTTTTATVFIDTIYPELHMDMGVNVVDTETYLISGWCYDANGVTVTVSGITAHLESGRFSVAVPLTVGENTITVTAVDGVGLTVTYERYVIRLITDRTQTDVDILLALLAEQNRAALADPLKGGYNDTDMARVCIATLFLIDKLASYGFSAPYAGKEAWTLEDISTISQTQAYITNVAQVRQTLPVEAPEVPPDMEGLTFGEANDIEKILVEVDAIFPLIEKSWPVCGEVICGEW